MKNTDRIPGQRDKFKPYIRLMKGNEYSDNFRTSLRLSILGSLRHERKVYVCLQKGCGNHAIMVGLSKEDIKKSPLAVACKRKTFSEWANEMKRHAQRKPLPKD